MWDCHNLCEPLHQCRKYWAMSVARLWVGLRTHYWSPPYLVRHPIAVWAKSDSGSSVKGAIWNITAAPMQIPWPYYICREMIVFALDWWFDNYAEISVFSTRPSLLGNATSIPTGFSLLLSVGSWFWEKCDPVLVLNSPWPQQDLWLTLQLFVDRFIIKSRTSHEWIPCVFILTPKKHTLKLS